MNQPKYKHNDKVFYVNGHKLKTGLVQLIHFRVLANGKRRITYTVSGARKPIVEAKLFASEYDAINDVLDKLHALLSR